MISLIAARSKNGVIGQNNKMPWHIPEELKYFRKITTGYTVIMGKSTLLSIGRALPNRRNIVLSSDRNFSMENVEVIHSVEEALAIVKEEEEAFVIGGKITYNQFLPFAQKLYITEIDAEFTGDTFFPDFDTSEWEVISKQKGLKDESNNYDYYYMIYKRIVKSY